MNAIPDWKLERFLLGELGEADMRQIQEVLESDPSLQARLDALQQSNREIHEKYPPGWMSNRIRDKLAEATPQPRSAPARARRAWGIPRTVLVPAAVVAALALFIFVSPELLPTGGPTTEVARFKGTGLQLSLYRKTDGGSEQLSDGDVAREGDLILLQYKADEQVYGAIVSVDGRGTVTTHLPAEGKRAEQIEPVHAHLMSYAYELDDAPRWEVFFFVTSSSPFQVDTVTAALEASPMVKTPRAVEAIGEEFLRSLVFPDDYRVTAFTLRKGESRHED
jgi:hypothetical protein